MYLLRATEEILIGRDPKVCDIAVAPNSLDVSNKHLRIYSVIFDDDDLETILPLVYAQDLSRFGTLWNGIPMPKDKGAILLSHGDTMEINREIAFQYQSRRIPSFDSNPTQSAEKRVRVRVAGPQKLGEGGHGKVHLAFSAKSHKQFACKVVDLKGLRALASKHLYDEHLMRYKRELDVMKSINHPNIVALEKVFITPDTIYIFQELITGGDLFSYIVYKGGYLQDIHAAIVIRQILKALAYLHDRGIVHRDIKPENVLIASRVDNVRVVLADFGAARLVESEGEAYKMFSQVGTIDYAAPEIKDPTGYAKSVDMWSVGALTAVVLTGESFFADETHPDYQMQPEQVILQRTQICDLSKIDIGASWKHVGSRPKDFVKSLLVLDQSKRLSAQQGLSHEWFTNKHHSKYFDPVYDVAVSSWKPRRKRFRIAEYLNIEDETMDDELWDGLIERTGADVFTSEGRHSFAGTTDDNHDDSNVIGALIPICIDRTP
ncbi:MAG: hypothetical protein M1819_005406 [Sarea resinae]|nr:MAG: hypothetical protein M1819_005406 [Sarea resinae]